MLHPELKSFTSICLPHDIFLYKLYSFSEIEVFLIGGAIERARPNEIFAIEFALSIAPPIRNTPNSLQI